MPAYADAILRELGLSSTELRSYRFLLQAGVATPTAVAGATGQSRGRIYETLETLVRRGLARVEPSRPIRYVAVPMTETISMALADCLGRTQRLRDAFESLVHTTPTWEPPEPITPPVEALMKELQEQLARAGPLAPPADLDARQVEIQYYSSVMEARRRILCLGPVGWSRHLSQGWQATIGVYAHARQRGVEFRALTPDVPDERATLAPFRAVWELRLSDWLPAWIVVVDDEHLFHAVPVAGESRVPVVRHSREANEIQFYSQLFERLWSQGRPWQSPPSPAAGKN